MGMICVLKKYEENLKSNQTDWKNESFLALSKYYLSFTIRFEVLLQMLILIFFNIEIFIFRLMKK